MLTAFLQALKENERVDDYHDDEDIEDDDDILGKIYPSVLFCWELACRLSHVKVFICEVCLSSAIHKTFFGYFIL